MKKIYFSLRLGFLVGIMLCCLTPLARAGDDDLRALSVFFTGKEAKKIERAVQRASLKPPALTFDTIELGAVLYYGPGQWTVWLQGERWTPKTSHPYVRILNVEADRVRLSVTPFAGEAPREITLRPHQNYQVLRDLIVEGKP